MHHFIYLIHLILVIFVIDCNSRSYNKKDQSDCSSQEQDTSECESDNEVNNISNHQDVEDSKDRGGKNQHSGNLTSWKVVREYDKKKRANVRTTETGKYIKQIKYNLNWYCFKIYIDIYRQT